MERGRFDTLAKAVAAAADRRRLLGALVRSVLAGQIGLRLGPVEAKRKKKKRKKHKRKKHPLCPLEPFTQCTGPAIDAFVAASEQCGTLCADDPELDSCLERCLQPAVDTAVGAAVECAAEMCDGRLGDLGGAATAPVSMALHNTDEARNGAASGPCNSAELKKCKGRRERDIAICMGTTGVLVCRAGPAACASGIFNCYVTYFKGLVDCEEDYGCYDRGWCVQNVCCPSHQDSPCGKVCCDGTKCLTCTGGVCQSRCKPPATCEHAVGGIFQCFCPLIGYELCGDSCCDTSKCEVCALVDGVGTCVSKCRPSDVCKDGECVDACTDGIPCGSHCCNWDEECQGGTCVKRCGQGEKACRGQHGEVFCCKECAVCCTGPAGSYAIACCQPPSCGGAYCGADGICVGGTASCPCNW